MQRFYGYTGGWGGSTATQAANVLDPGVWVMIMFAALFDHRFNFAPAGQYLATDATTKLQIRGSLWGNGSSFLEVITRMIRPVSGSALFN